MLPDAMGISRQENTTRASKLFLWTGHPGMEAFRVAGRGFHPVRVFRDQGSSTAHVSRGGTRFMMPSFFRNSAKRV